MIDDASNQGRRIDELDKNDVVALMDDNEEDKKEEEAKIVEDDQKDEPAEVTIISATEPQVPAATITDALVRVAAASTRRRKGVPKPLKKKQQVKMDEEYARKLHAELNKDIDWDAAFDHMEEEESREIQSINETPTQKATKRRKLNEEVEDFNRHLEIVPDKDDDVYTETTPLAIKQGHEAYKQLVCSISLDDFVVRTMPPRKSIRGNPPPPLTQDTVNRMIQESVKAAIRTKTERVQNEANRAEGPNVAPIGREYFMKCNPITFPRNEGAVEMKVMMTEEFCPPEEIQRMESKLWNLRVKEMDISSYTTRFNELVILCPGMVPMERKKVKAKAEREADNKKRKWENFQGGSSSGGGNNNSNRNSNNYNSNPTGENAQLVVTCYGCREKGHIKTNCPARNNLGRNEACRQAYALRDGDQNLRPNVVTGTFLLNNHYARVLFDSGSDKSFMNINFSRLIDIKTVKVNHTYEVELADGRVKENQGKDKIGSKPDKNGKRAEAGKSLKQWQLKEEEKPKKTKKRMAKNAYTDQKLLNFKEKKKKKEGQK
nr:reverse transcriptase domain-containing protein [Tanacetum cinerariifolium]